MAGKTQPQGHHAFPVALSIHELDGNYSIAITV
jgi:hypothetical protein